MQCCNEFETKVIREVNLVIQNQSLYKQVSIYFFIYELNILNNKHILLRLYI